MMPIAEPRLWRMEGEGARPGPRAARDTTAWSADLWREVGQWEEAEEEAEEEEAEEVEEERGQFEEAGEEEEEAIEVEVEVEGRGGSEVELSSEEELDVTAAPVGVMRIDRWEEGSHSSNSRLQFTVNFLQCIILKREFIHTRRSIPRTYVRTYV